MTSSDRAAHAVPDTFLVGAPRGGTTSLYGYLAEHDAVFAPVIKEPHYFSPDMYVPWSIRDEADYMRLYGDRPRSTLRALDGSTRYLQSREAAGRIDHFNPESRVIMVLRNPVDMMYSLHSQLYSGGWEPIGDFSQALLAEEDRLRCSVDQAKKFPPLRLCYRDCARYAEGLQRFWRALGRERVQVIIYDDFVDSPQRVYDSVCEFLDIEPRLLTSRISNANYTPRSRLIERLRPRSTRVRTVMHRVLPPRLLTTISQLNKRHEKRAPMAEDLRASLTQDLHPEVERLAEMLERDLSSWMI